MGITVHFHAGGGDAAGQQSSGRGASGEGESTGKGMGGGMDGGASLPAAGAAATQAGTGHVDTPANAIDAGGPPAALVNAVESALGRRGADSDAAGGDTGMRMQGNDGGGAPQ